jgi:malonate-semialdehyde dehydrogenase (acetylating)/methylmalonate-semialdehyde dehydrogenase
MAISVVVAVGSAGDALTARIADRLPALKVGPGNQAGNGMGPLITAEHRDRVKAYIDAGVEQGAMLVADGRSLVVDGHEDGFWCGPTLFDHVTPAMSIYTDEIFGPVLSVVRVDTYDEALELVNSNPYANGAALFTCDGGVARKFQHEVEVGMVGINVPIPVPASSYSFGGWRNSLFGDTHMYGAEGVRFWTRGKVVTSRWPSPDHRGVNLGFPQN